MTDRFLLLPVFPFTRTRGKVDNQLLLAYAATNNERKGLPVKRLIASLCLLVLNISASHAAVTINIVESGGSVQAVFSGGINTSALGSPGPPSANISPFYLAGIGSFATSGVKTPYPTDAAAWTPYGPPNLVPIDQWDSTSGDPFAMYSGGTLGLPVGYVSQSPLSGTATKASSTFATLGFTPGTYVTTLTNGLFLDTVTINIGPSTPTYTVGGSVSGLTGSVTIQNNAGDDIVKTTNDGFTFTAQAEGTDYAVTVSSQPVGQTCAVGNGSGTNITANVTNVTVTCVDDVVPTYSVGGTVTGLTGTGLALQNNGGDTLAVAANGPFGFVTELLDSAAYAVTVSTQPTGQACSVTNGSGTISTANVTDVGVTCVDDAPPPPAPATPVPTLSEWALITLAMLLAGIVFVRRKQLT